MGDLVDKVVQDLKPDTAQFKVLTYLAFRGASQPSTISEEIGIAPGTARPALRSLLEKGYIKQLSDGSYRSGVPFTDFVSALFASKR